MSAFYMDKNNIIAELACSSNRKVTIGELQKLGAHQRDIDEALQYIDERKDSHVNFGNSLGSWLIGLIPFFFILAFLIAIIWAIADPAAWSEEPCIPEIPDCNRPSGPYPYGF